MEKETLEQIETTGGLKVDLKSQTGDKNKFVIVYRTIFNELDEGCEDEFEAEYVAMYPTELDDIGSPIDGNGEEMEYVGIGFAI